MLNITGTLICKIDEDTQIWDDGGLYGVEVDEEGEHIGVFPLNEVNRSWIEPRLPEGVSFPED
jgi:hypothetical protein